MSTQTDINNTPTPRLTLVVAILVAANVAFFLLTLITNTDPTRAFGLSVAPFAEATNPFSWLWSLRLLVLHSFFHQNWGHLIPNMMFLLAFGPILEFRIGSRAFAYLYGTAVLVSGLFSLYMHPAPDIESGEVIVALIGASGAISAVIAAVLLTAPRTVLMVVGGYVIQSWMMAVLFFVYQATQLALPGAMADSVGIHMIGALSGLAFIVGQKVRAHSGSTDAQG